MMPLPRLRAGFGGKRLSQTIMATNPALIGQVSDDQLAELQKKYKGFYHIEVDGHIAYFRGVDRKVMNYAMGQLDPTAPLDYFENVMRDTKVAGSDDIIEDDDLFLGAVAVLKEVLEAKTATLVKH